MNTYKKSTLPNGIRLITVPIKDAQTATIIAIFATGSRYEEDPIAGMSHFLEHMFFKGTEKRPTTLDISKELDGVGAEFNAFTGKDHTGYYVKAAHQHLPLAVDVVSDMLLNSKFDAEELEKEKGVIVEEINMYEDNPLMYIHDIYEEEMYKGSKLGRLISGSRETVRATTREAMVEYKETHYRGDNTVIVVAGKLPDDVEALVQESFAALKGETKENQFGYDVFPVDQTQPRVRLLHRPAEQAQLALGFPAYSYTHKDIVPLKVLGTILGGNMSSRLFVEVREKRGLAYMVRVGVQEYQDTGNFMIQAGLDKERVSSAVEVVRQEAEKLTSTPVTDDELKRAKDYIQGKTSIALEDTDTLASWYATQEAMKNRFVTPQQKFDQVKAVSKEDIQRVARDIFDFKKSTLAMIGPFKDEETFKNLLS